MRSGREAKSVLFLFSKESENLRDAAPLFLDTRSSSNDAPCVKFRP